MQLGRSLRELWDLKRGVALGLVVAGLVAIWSVYEVKLTPPSLQSRSTAMGAASTRVFVDAPRSLLLDMAADTGEIEGLTNRSLLIGNVMVSRPVREFIARRAGIPVSELKVTSPITRRWPRPLAQSGETKHASDILASPAGYRLHVRVNPTVPVIDISALGPTAEQAAALANGAVAGMRDYLHTVALEQDIAFDQQARFEQLGLAKGGVVTEGAGLTIAALVFALVLGTWCVALRFLSRVRRGWSA